VTRIGRGNTAQILISAGNLSFVSLERTLQLWSIRILALSLALQAVSEPVADRTQTPQSGDLRLSVTQIKRAKPDEVELRIILKNEGNHDLYLPTQGSGEDLQIDSLGILQWSPLTGWRRLGASTELPPTNAIRLRPGQSYTQVTWLSDPTVTPLSREGIPVFKGEPLPLRGQAQGPGWVLWKQTRVAVLSWLCLYPQNSKRKAGPTSENELRRLR
jgi:hypothetical protein